MATNIATDSPLANKIFSVALMGETQRSNRMLALLSEKAAATQKQAVRDREKMQTSSGMPVVSVTDLAQQAGDRISIDLYHDINGKPIMGSRMAEGKGKRLSFDTDEFIINQSRMLVQPQNKMSQKRTKHNLRQLAMSALKKYFGRLGDQRLQVHLAGARGDEVNDDWVLPLQSDADFNEIMINTVHPPSTGRYYVCGDATNPGNISNNDALTLNDIDVIVSQLRSTTSPVRPLECESTPDMFDEYCQYVMFVTEWQWHYMLTADAPNTNRWREFVGAAAKRAAITKHPLFRGDAGIWNGVLIRRIPRPIQFNAGSIIKRVDENTGSEITDNASSQVDSGITVHRALLLGAQALACVAGNATPSGSGYRDAMPSYWSEKWLDHGDKLEVLGGLMDGMGKLRFTDSEGKLNDYGVYAIDSYCPNPNSAAGSALRSAL